MISTLAHTIPDPVLQHPALVKADIQIHIKGIIRLVVHQSESFTGEVGVT
jgi:hypothetical protein